MANSVTFSREFMRNLVDRFRDPEAYQHALDQAQQQTLNMFELLAKRMKDNNHVDEWHQIEQQIEALIEQPDSLIDWHATDRDYLAPIHLAAISACPKLMQWLLEQRYDPNRLYENRNDTLTLPLLMTLAATNSPSEFVQNRARRNLSLLLEAGANPQGPSDKIAVVQPPLHLTQDPESVQLLLEYGADPSGPHTQLGDGGNALHNAVENTKLEKVRLLLDAGIPLAATNRRNMTAARIAFDRAEKYSEDQKESYVPATQQAAANLAADAGQIRRELATREWRATELYEDFCLNPSLADLPPHGFVYFANIGRLKEVLTPKIWQGQEQLMLNHLLRLPLWLQHQQAPLITTLVTKLHTPDTAIWNASIEPPLPKDISR